MKEIREVFAKARREGYSAFFFQRGGKTRLDFLLPKKDEQKKIPDRLGVHFQAMRKIVFRGSGGEAKERWMGILTILYGEGVLKKGEKIKISRAIQEGAEEALRELEALDENLAKLYLEEKTIGENEIEIIEDEKTEFEQGFEGKKREEFEQMSAEEWFYRKILVPVVTEEGGKETEVIPQMEFRSLFGDEKDERRVDFFLSNERGKGMVIEIDDSTHLEREERDEERDKLIRGNRMRVFRIKDEELKDVEKAKKTFLKALKGFYEPLEGPEKAQEGLSGERRSPNAIMLKNHSERDFIAFNGKIYVGEEPENPVLVQEVEFPYEILNYRTRSIGEKKIEFLTGVEGKEVMKWLLGYIFKFSEFKEGQYEAIQKVLRGEDAIVLLPTGAGKSVIYQLLGLILPGVVIVVEPLRALMADQVANLEQRGINLVVNTSEDGTLTQKKRVLEMIKNGMFGMIYVTPERLQMEEFRRVLIESKARGVRYFLGALDEAHCVSEWGHDFRVSYLSLAETLRRVLRSKQSKPRILALTGTASDDVLRDMERDLGISEEQTIQSTSFDRPEIHFRVIKTCSEGKMAILEELLEEMKKDFPGVDEKELRGIVFCVYKTGSSEFGVEGVYRKIAERFGEEDLARYYGGEETAVMKENMRRFKDDEARIMIATKAFGMGIDKKNIRFTIHFGITNSIEAYYQEAGRGGRDGEKAMSYIILSNDAPERNEELLTGVTIEDMGRELRRVREKDRDDLYRILFLHQRNFNKREMLRTVGRVLEKLGRISTEREEEKHIVAENRLEMQNFQKVLFRLKILGVIEDYTIFDYANNEFLVLNKKFEPKRIVMAYGEYVAKYQEGQRLHEMNKIKRQSYKNQGEFIVAQLEILLDFIDGVFEKSRRRAILNMLQLAEAGARIKNLDEADKEIRRRVLNYLGATNKELLKTILNDKKIIQQAVEAMRRVRKKDEMGLVAEGKRLLASYPEHPGLLMLVGFLEMIDEETEVKQAVLDILSAEENSEKYGISSREFSEAIEDMLRYSYGKARSEGKYREGVEELERRLRNKYPDIREKMVGVLPPRFTNLFQGEILVENMVMSLMKIRYREEDLWTGRN